MSQLRKTVDDLDTDIADILAQPATLYSLLVKNHGSQDLTVKLYDALAEDAGSPAVTLEIKAHRSIVNGENNPSYPLHAFATAISGEVVVHGGDVSPDVLPVLEFEFVVEDQALSGVATVLLGDDSVEVQHPSVTEDSVIVATSLQDDATAKNVTSVVPANGSFTINVKATATANMKVGYSILS